MLTEANELFIITSNFKPFKIHPKMLSVQNITKGNGRANKNGREMENRFEQMYHQPVKWIK